MSAIHICNEHKSKEKVLVEAEYSISEVWESGPCTRIDYCREHFVEKLNFWKTGGLRSQEIFQISRIER